MRKHTHPPRSPRSAAAALALTACGGVENTTGGGERTASEYPPAPSRCTSAPSAGGSSDLISRAVSKGLSDELGGSFPVINREGANGALAAAEVAKAEPDGSTIAIQNASLFAITPLAVGEDEVTSIDDFDVVQGVSRDDYVWSPARTAASDARGHQGRDARSHLRHHRRRNRRAARLRADVRQPASTREAVPFDGGAPALTAVLGNQVDTACLQVGEAIENIESGKIVPLSVFGPERVEYLPDVPTAKEQGLDVEVSQYRFMTVPKGTPDDVKDTIAEAMQATFKTEEYQAFNSRTASRRWRSPATRSSPSSRRTRSGTPTWSTSTASTSATS